MAADSEHCDDSSMASGGSNPTVEEDIGGGFHDSGIPRRVSVETHWSDDAECQDAAAPDDEVCDAATGNDGQPMSSNTTGRAITSRTSRQASFRAECLPRDALVDSITWLGCHVPSCVLSSCIEEIRNNPGSQASEESAEFAKNCIDIDAFHGDEMLPMNSADEMLPFASRHEAALLFVDISGFTKLSTQMDVESLSKVINGYFQMLVNEVRSYGGDILKFAGDAFFAEWRATQGRPLGNASSIGVQRWDDHQSCKDIVKCVTMAAECGASIVNKFSDCPVFYPEDSQTQIASLNCHCGLGVGEIGAGHFGNTSRREFLIFGEPIDQVASAERQAGHGEVWASSSFIQILSKGREIEEVTETLVAEGLPALLAARSKKCFGETKGTASNTKFVPQHDPNESMADRCKDMSISSLECLRKCLSLYVHSVVVAGDPGSFSTIVRGAEATRGSMRRMRSFIGLGATAQNRHLAEAELRSVFTMFIRPSIDIKMCDSDEANTRIVNLMNDIMAIITSELDSHGGHLRQYIVDDKGVVLIANFGLRGSTYPSMVEERALPSARSIHYSLETDLGIESTIGCTLGDAYCGVVGGLERHEFAVLGPSVNLAARLMTAPENRGILVDNFVRLKAGKQFSFDPLPPVNAKGYENPVLIFEPLTSRERRWGKVDRNFVGRDEEVNTIVDAATKITDAETKASEFIQVSGHGKTSLLVLAIAMARKILRVRRKHIIVTRNIGKEGDTIVPFSIFRSIFLDVLAELESGDHEGSLASSGGPLKSMAGSVSQMSHLSSRSNANSFDGSLDSNKLQSAVERLRYLSEELNAPPEFMLIVGHHLLGLQSDELSSRKDLAGSKLALDDIVDFMAKAFIRCTSHADVVVLALDDVQHLDDLSWRVVQTIYRQGENLLILCASKDSDGGVADKLDWVSRHQEIDIPPLTIDETKELIAKMLGYDEADIDPNLAKDVHVQCNGFPAFAVEVIKNMKKGDLVARGESGIVGLKNSHQSVSQSSLGDLILHQIDLLDASVRSTLQIAATLGVEFCLSDVVEVAAQMDRVQQEERPEFHQDFLDAFAVAAEEGILCQIFEGQEYTANERDSGDPEESFSQVLSTSVTQTGLGENRTYSFAHAVWRDNILKVLLESRKKEIHFNVALVLETKEETKGDLYSNLRLFRHRKESGDWSKASESALEIGKVLENIGLHEQAIDVLKEALSFWRVDPNTAAEVTSDKKEVNADPGRFGGVVLPSAIESATVGEIKSMVRLLISLGQVLANMVKGKESAAMYDAAIAIIQSAPASRNLKDRTFIFPCFSGLFISLKFGDIKDDENCTYEKDLVKKFVTQAKLNGDPIHYTRALSMQGETYGRLGEYDKAFEAHRKLESIYDPDKHSAGVCKAYGSDRSAQSFSHSTRWKIMIGDPGGALKTCRYIVEVLMPKMEERNVHNSCMMLWPVLWVMKDMGLALEARAYFDTLVVQTFQKHFGEGGSTGALAAYKPTLMLLYLAGHQDDEGIDQEKLAEYTAWAVDSKNMDFSSGLNGAMSAFSRDLDSIAAEICLLLAKRTQSDDATKTLLINNGLVLAEKSLERCRRKIAAFGQISPVYEELKGMK